MTHAWSIAKDAIGLFGSCLATLPWFRDFLARVRLARVKTIPVGSTLRQLKLELESSVESWISRPKLLDFVFTILGLLLVGVSFLIGLWQSLAE